MTKKRLNSAANNGTQFMKSEIDELFALAKVEDKVRIVVGNNIVSQKKFDTFEEAEKYIASKPYELIINVSCLFMVTKQKQDEKENKTAE